MKPNPLVLIPVVYCLEVVLLTSPKTPFPIHEVLLRLSPFPGMSLTVMEIEGMQTGKGWKKTADLYLDYTYRPELYPLIQLGVEGRALVGMYVDSPIYEAACRANSEEMARRIVDFLYEKNLTSVFVAYSSPRFQPFMSAFNAQSSLTLSGLESLPESLSDREMDQFVGRVLKPSGSSTAVLYLDERTGVSLISKLKQFHIYKEGFLYLLSQEAAWGQTEEGLLYFTDTAAVSATDPISYEALVLADRLMQFSTRTASEHREIFEMSLSLVNIVNGKPRRVQGYAEAMVFPGNSTLLPKGEMLVIDVWADLEGKEVDGTVYEPWKAIRRGTILGYQEANRRKDLTPTFQFRNCSVTFGAFRFNKTWAVSQIQQALTRPGIAYHGFLFTATVISLYQTFQELGLSLPMTANSASSALSSLTQFPLFARTMSSTAASALVMTRFFSVFGWKRVAVVYSTGAVDVEFYAHFQKISSQHRIEIVNEHLKRQIPLDLANGQKELNETLLDILKSTVRIIVLSHTHSQLIAARLYDLGARAGDYEICLNFLSSTSFSSEQFRHARQIVKGAMLFRDRLFGGKDGPSVKAQLLAADGPSYEQLACVNYDSAMLVAHATHYMLYKGLHFEQGLELVKAMRSTRFNGCLGTIQIESGSNDIRLSEFSLMNVHLVGDIETLEIVEAAIYSPTRIQLYTLLPELQFPDNSSSFPDSWETDVLCPYLSRYIQDFPRGQYLAIGLNFGFMVLMAIPLTVVILMNKWQIGQEVLKDKHPMSIYDGFVLCGVLVELVQLFALAPSIGLPQSIRNLLGIGAIDIWEIVRFSEGVFAGIEAITFSLISTYLLLYLVRIRHIYVRLKKCYLCRVMGRWSKILVQPIGRFLFFPIVSVLLSTFVCDRATGPGFSDSFLAADCWERCWQGRHLSLAIVSAGLLCIYTPIAILSRPFWQDLHPGLHVKGSPMLLVAKAFMQLALIATFVSLRTTHPTWHAILYFCISGAYTVLIHFLRPYNYERLNLWERLSMLAVCYYALLGVLKTHTSSISDLYTTVSLAVALSLLLILGLFLQCLHPKYQSQLVRGKEDRYDIIKFAFTFGISAQRHLQAFQTKQRFSRICIEEPTPQVLRRVPLPSINLASQ